VKLGFVTHYDVDHMGGFASFDGEGITFEAVYDQGPSPMRNGKPKYVAYIEWVGDPNDNAQEDPGEDHFVRHEASVGIHFTLGDAKIRILSARGDTKGTEDDIALDPEDGADFHDNENPGSIALLVTLGEFEFYTAGDQTSDDWGRGEPDTEFAVIHSKVISETQSDIDVLKVNHHGSDTSTGTAFVQALDPEVAVISTKISSNHRLPKLVAIKQLIENGALVYITGNGLKSDRTFHLSAKQGDDEGYTPPADGFINSAGDVHIFVSADGSRYRVFGGGDWREFSAVDADNPH
jgi:hypothetical protein